MTRGPRLIDGIRVSGAAGRRFASAFVGSAAWSLWLVVGAWYVQASTFLLVGLAVDVVPGGSGAIRVDVVSAGVGRPWGVGLTALGLISAVGCVLVVLGHGFAVPALVASGTIGTMILAALGSWAAVVVPAAMIVGVALTLATDALDHLHPSPTPDGRAGK